MKTYKSIELIVSDDYELPDFYQTNDTKKNEEALDLGAFIYQQVGTHRSSTQLQTLEQQKAKELAHLKDQLTQIRTAHQLRQEEMETQIETLNQAHAIKLNQLLDVQAQKEESAKLGEREVITRQYDTKLKALSQDLAVLTEQNRGLQARRDQLEADRAKDVKEAEEKTASWLQTTIDEKERTIQRLETMLNSLTNSHKDLRQAFEDFSSNHLAKTSSSKAKGTTYEIIMGTKLRTFYGANPGFALEEKSKSSVGHEADIIMSWNDKKVLWEGKWYKDAIPSSQITKFIRDMHENPHILVGVMMSRDTAITGKCERGDIQTEFDGNQMMIYVSRADNYGDVLYSMLPQLWKVHWENKRDRHEDEDRDKAIRLIDSLIATIAKRKLDWNVHKSRTNEMLKWMNDQIGEDEDKLKKAFSILKSGDKEVDEDSELSALFVDPEGNTTIEDTIGVLKTLISPENEESDGAEQTDAPVMLKDLAELFMEASATKITIDTAKTRIRKAIRPDLLESQKGGPIRIYGIVLHSVTG